MLDCIEIPPPQPARACVIWLHGLGADGNDFVPIVPELDLGPSHDIKFIFPNAPQRPVSINNGLRMPAWYDIREIDITARQDRDGLDTSAGWVEALIARETTAGIPAARIVLAGFSQGGAVALHTGLRHGQALAGIMALSSYVPLHDQMATKTSKANTGAAVFMAHGTQDPIIPITLGRASRDILTTAGYRLDWHEYPMGHQVCPPEIVAIGHWLRGCLGHGA